MLGIYLLNIILICIPNINHQYIRAKLKVHEIRKIQEISPINTVLYSNPIKESLVSNKFLAFYANKLKNANIQEVSQKEIMEYCGISENAIEQFTECPHGGTLIIGDFRNSFVNYFYLK